SECLPNCGKFPPTTNGGHLYFRLAGRHGLNSIPDSVHGDKTYTRRFFGGRQPLCGNGVTSSMPVTFRPAFCRLRIACSRPAPGPLTFTSISTMPLLRAVWAAFSAARPAAKGVLL